MNPNRRRHYQNEAFPFATELKALVWTTGVRMALSGLLFIPSPAIAAWLS